MEMLGHRNNLFKNIFPDYDVFKTWYTSLPLSDGVDDVPSQKTFALIAFEYNDSRVYSSDDSFKEHFAIDLYTYYKEFEETTKGIVELMNLSAEDISTSGIVITNTAEIPETEGSTDAEEVNFISVQQKNISKKGSLQVTRELLSNKRAFTVKTFLGRFRHLFIKILSPAYTYVVGEPQED